MKQALITLFAFAAGLALHAKNITITVKNSLSTNIYQHITGFGAACCDGAMLPYGTDTNPVKLLYGPTSKIGLNIMRMEISPNFKGDIANTSYDWNGCLPSAKIVKQRGGIVFGTPWSPPGEYKTNGSAQGGNADNQGNIRAELREDCYEKFFPWLNTYLEYMKKNGVNVDAVSIQNEPDWWVNYSGCLYTPKQQVNLIRNYAHMLDRETYPGVRLISAEPLGFAKEYYDAILNNPTAREQVDIFAGHIYGHAPLQYIKPVADAAKKYKKEIWMTEHSVTDNTGKLPTWDEQLIFAQELNECMLAGCTGYIYWYMRAHWAFIGTGETKYGTANKKNQLLPRAYIMSHYSRHVTGSTRIYALASAYPSPTTGTPFQTTAYMKGDSIIVQAINATKDPYDVKVKLPAMVDSCLYIRSTGNEKSNLCQQVPVTIEEPLKEIVIPIPASSVNTFIFNVSHEEETAILPIEDSPLTRTHSTYYDMLGRRTTAYNGLLIEKRADGTTRKILRGSLNR